MKNQVDGDVITYQVGFASDTTIYSCPDGREFNYKKEAVQHCKDFNMVVTTIDKRVEAEPVENCLHSVKQFLKSIKEDTGASDQNIFLTGKGQWREEAFPDYKANRDRTHKPIHYQAIKDYMIGYHGATEIIGSEADDAMAWTQWKDKATRDGDQLGAESCICTIDKDLNMVPGLHYNWNANKGAGALFWIDDDTGLRLFFEQWLSGDAADNIPGIPKIGVVKAAVILAPYIGAGAMYEKIISEWQAHTNHPNEYINMIGDLLWMERIPGETWDQHLELSRE